LGNGGERHDPSRDEGIRSAWLRLTAGALVLATTPATGACAATVTVDATADTLANDGNCTLREAILAANSNGALRGLHATARFRSYAIVQLSLVAKGEHAHLVSHGHESVQRDVACLSE
jgi:CSLREA domain-containing protein